MDMPRWSSRVASLLLSACAALALPGCAAEPGDEADGALEGEVAGGDVDSSEDALTTREVTAYAPIAPPEHHDVARSALPRLPRSR
jgi:hypothetical protein